LIGLARLPQCESRNFQIHHHVNRHVRTAQSRHCFYRAAHFLSFAAAVWRSLRSNCFCKHREGRFVRSNALLQFL
jgi:hypothetical protein